MEHTISTHHGTRVGILLPFWRRDCVFDEIRNFTLQRRVRIADGHFGEGPVNRNDQYLSYAAECQQMACITRNEHERRVWLDMAQSWLKLVQLHACASLSQFGTNWLGNAA